ncbi:hypothetical protein ACFL2R_02415 [Patescibacteria group bacterium]
MSEQVQIIDGRQVKKLSDGSLIPISEAELQSQDEKRRRKRQHWQYYTGKRPDSLPEMIHVCAT